MEELILRKQVMDILGFKSINGFKRFCAVHPDFPAPVARDSSFSSRVCFFKSEVAAFMAAVKMDPDLLK